MKKSISARGIMSFWPIGITILNLILLITLVIYESRTYAAIIFSIDLLMAMLYIAVQGFLLKMKDDTIEWYKEEVKHCHTMVDAYKDIFITDDDILAVVQNILKEKDIDSAQEMISKVRAVKNNGINKIKTTYNNAKEIRFT